jgi:hypothetical protein
MTADEPILTGPHQVAIGEWALDIQLDALPSHYGWLVERARLVEEVELRASDARLIFAAIYSVGTSSLDRRHPILVLAQRYSPYEAGFDPGFLIVPHTATLFVGAGERLLAYDLRAPKRLWSDTAWPGFWRWGSGPQYVWMLSELEFAVWSPRGEKLWTTPVEPPWEADVVGEVATLDIMGRKEKRRMSDGQLLA